MRSSSCRATTIRCCIGATVDAIDMHWIAGSTPALPRAARREDALPDGRRRVHGRARRRVRYRDRFDAPQWAPTPGQYLVLYDGDVCLGGGVIAATANPDERELAPAHAEDSTR